MDFIKEKIRVMKNKLELLKVVSERTLEYQVVDCPEYKKDNTPPSEDAPWRIAGEYERFSGVDTHYWLHMTVETGSPRENSEPRLCVKTGREGEWDAKNPQVTVFIDGKTVQGMDTNHTWLPLEFDKTYDVYMYLYTGMEGGDFCFVPTLEIVDLRIETLYYDIKVPYECMELLGDDSTDYIKIRKNLDKACLLLDLRDIYSNDFYTGIDNALKYMKDEFYGKVCSKDTVGTLNCIGHTHIDVAWLWTVMQTREKAQRSFSTVLNLMNRYDDYKFMSSQPQLYQHVKENDPGMYEEIKERIKEGRWEAEGAMWLEADTNLISGESLVRQIMYGKSFMKEEFGVDNKILWLPDVFGYSGALPQILRKTGVTQFFTTKMNWNETNKLPHDMFEWEGIDGSRVFANLIPFYVLNLMPQKAKMMWDLFKDKDISDEALVTFGFGDGGGGTTYEMMENHRLLQHGIPGMPKTVIKKGGEHFNKAEKDFYLNTSEYARPKWVGEMYLEMHRGTYTSMAKNKKNNRKSELLYLEAETCALADMLLCGGKYPADLFKKNHITILLNQFHDIIPGSSIKEVYDVTDSEYAEILKDGRKITNNALSVIKANLKTAGGIFVYNPTPFVMSDYITVEDKTYFAENVPSHGWKVVPAIEAKSKVSVTDKVIENDLIKITFNDKYHIVSVYDKELCREVLSQGAEANRFEVYEDYPREYDAWEITDYYKQKMWVADDVSSVEILPDGIRITRKYCKSEIRQDIVLKPGSKRVDFVTKIDWQEDHVLLKAAFPVDVHNVNATYDIQFGNIQRPTHKNTSWDKAKFEVCAHKWADLSEADYGVSIINDCKYGYSIEDNIMKISLLKAATYPNPEADRGLNEFTYCLYPHNGNLESSDTVKQGYLVNMPLEASVVEKTNGIISDSYSLISSDNDSVVVETIKKAEEDDSVVVRMYETYNSKQTVTLTTGFDFKEVYVCDMLENNERKLEHSKNTVKVRLGNFEIVTLKFVR